MKFEGHTHNVSDGAFLDDESHVITGSSDNSLHIWSISDGVHKDGYDSYFCVRHPSTVSIYVTDFVAMQLQSLSYHAASGNIVGGLDYGFVQFWQTAPHTFATKVVSPANVCVRNRLAAAQAELRDIETSLEKTDESVHQQLSREQELKQSIADLEAKRAYHSHMAIS